MHASKYQSYCIKGTNTQLQTHTHTQAPDKAVGLAQGSMAAGLTGAQPGWQVVRGSAEAQPSLRLSGFLFLAPLQTKALESSDKHREGANCHWGACLLWLIINYCAADSKPLCLRPLHQSNTLVFQRPAGMVDGQCYSLLSGLAALW